MGALLLLCYTSGAQARRHFHMSALTTLETLNTYTFLKQFIAHLVRIELEGEKFDLSQVWAPAWARLEKKILALKFKVNETKRRADSRGEKPPDLSKRSKCTKPIAEFNDDGDLKWNDKLFVYSRILSF